MPAAMTASGDGRTLLEIAPNCERSCQVVRIRIGRTHGRIIEYHRCFICSRDWESFQDSTQEAAATLSGANSFATTSPVIGRENPDFSFFASSSWGDNRGKSSSANR